MGAGSMGRVLSIAAGDIKLTVKEKSLIIWIFLMPLAFMFFFGMSFGRGGGSRPKATVTIEDRDGGFLAEDLIEALRGENINLVRKLEEGRDPVRTLVIPIGFTDDILARKKTRLILRKEEDSNFQAGEAAGTAIFRAIIKIAAGLIELELLEIGTGKGYMLVEGDSLIGNLEKAVGAEPAKAAVYESALDSIFAAEPLIEVATSLAGRNRKIPEGFQGSVPGSLVMFVLMSMVFSGTTIAIERVSGVLKRIAVSPASKSEIVAGKLLGRMAVAGVQILFLLIAGRFLFGVDLGAAYLALILLMGAFAFCAGSFSILFGSLFKNPDSVTGVAVITSLVMAALGGCWWPLEVVSRPFKIIAFIFPTGWTMDGLNKLIMFGYGLPSIALNILVLLVFGAAFLAAASRKLQITQ